eukprot:985452-Pleurochrysis_carterae.AAC.1
MFDRRRSSSLLGADTFVLSCREASERYTASRPECGAKTRFVAASFALKSSWLNGQLQLLTA